MKLKEVVQVAFEVEEVNYGDVFQFTRNSGGFREGNIIVFLEGSKERSEMLKVVSYDGIRDCFISLKYLSEEYTKGNLKYVGNLEGGPVNE